MVFRRECRRRFSKPLVGVVALASLWLALTAWMRTAYCEPDKSCPELGVMLNPANPIDTLSLDELRAIYTGQRIKWPGGAKSSL